MEVIALKILCIPAAVASITLLSGCLDDPLVLPMATAALTAVAMTDWGGDDSGAPSYGSESFGSSYSGATYASADDCKPVPPRCARANAEATRMLNNFPATTGMHDSASQAWCGGVNLGIGVNSACAVEYRATGREHCASILDRQVREYQSRMPQLEAAIAGTSASSPATRQACIWEG